ncbi:hypothetical protein, partial [Sphingomonas koreensis]
RGNHLGQRSRATAPKGRTYGSKRSDQIFRSALARGSRPHMELANRPARARCLMAHVNKVHSVRTIGLVAQELDKTEDEITVLALGMDMEDGLI